MKQDHLGLREEDIQKGQENGIRDLLQAMGDENADADALEKSEDGKIISQRMSLMTIIENSQEEKKYWESYGKGLHKKIFDKGLEKWAVYVPLRAKIEPERRFPLIFLLHGAHNPIKLTESYGVVQYAADKECIVLAPENENWDSIEGKINYAKDNLPVDWSRVYCVGYSFGGFMTSRNVFAHPEVFAGAGMGGMLFASKVRAHEMDGQYYPAYELTDDMIKKVQNIEMPMVLFMGENEMLRLLPLWREPVGETKNGVIPLSSAQKQQSFRNLRKAVGCSETEFLSKGENASETEMKIGVRFEETKILTYHHRQYYVGYSKNNNSECLFKTVACEGMVHWPSSMFAQLVLDHLLKYARDPETHRLIRL